MSQTLARAHRQRFAAYEEAARSGAPGAFHSSRSSARAASGAKVIGVKVKTTPRCRMRGTEFGAFAKSRTHMPELKPRRSIATLAHSPTVEDSSCSPCSSLIFGRDAGYHHLRAAFWSPSAS